MRGLNDKNPLNYLLTASDLTILKNLSRNPAKDFLQPVSCSAQAARICEKKNL
jgi:hypothetical protein